MAIADKEKVVLVTGYGAGIGCWGVGVGWPCSAGYCVEGLWSSGDPGGACAGGLGTVGMCRE